MEILCTLGPSSLNKETIKRMSAEGVSLFRLNLSHMKVEDLEKAVSLIRSSSDVPICFDSEGAQVRTAAFKDGRVYFEQNHEIRISSVDCLGTKEIFSLYPSNVPTKLSEGDIITLDFNAALLQVIKCDGKDIIAKVLNPGWVGSNKAVTVHKDIPLDSFTEKDLKAFEIAKKLNINHVALSFANFAEDVIALRTLMPKGTKIISKIECRNGLKNLESITQNSDAVLIDRGDLSRDVGVEFVPLWQKKIIAKARELKKKVYVATNFLETMISQANPTRAEVNDIYNTILDGADGLVLAAETAVGKYPIECVGILNKMYKIIENFNQNNVSFDETSEDGSLSLIAPHGGHLVQQNFEDFKSLPSMKKIPVNVETILDCFQITTGGYSPITGFMDRGNLESVLNNMTLENELTWTMPILLQINSNVKDSLKNVSQVGLYQENDPKQEIKYVLDIKDIYNIDLSSVAKRWFGTDESKHPGVAKFYKGGDILVAGKVSVVEHPHFKYDTYLFTPRTLRFIFQKKNWAKIVGFHSRNVPHRVHELIQLEAMERASADGLLISPILGSKKSGDFTTEIILGAYSKLGSEVHAYPENKYFIAGFNSYSRFCGPREAVFTALCRQNFGCSHFIVGRDHAGVGDYYERDGAEKIFQKLANTIGITPIVFGEYSYCLKQDQLLPIEKIQEIVNISGTGVRTSFKEGKRLPNWFIRNEIQDFIHDQIKDGKNVFVE